MADNAIGDILLFGAIAGVGYWLYTSLFSTSTTATTATPATGTSINPAVGSSAANSNPVPYVGPSLDAMYTALLAAVQDAYGVDTAVTCQAGASLPVGGGGAATSTSNGARTAAGGQIALNPNNSTGQPPTTVITTGSNLSGWRGLRGYRGLGDTCSMPMATYDVFNWYLTQRANVGISVAPAPPDNTTVVTIQQYWTWAAPLLQAQIPGLAGWGLRGMGHFGAIGNLCRGRR